MLETSSLNPQISVDNITPEEFRLTKEERRLAQLMLQYGMAIKSEDANELTLESSKNFLDWCDDIRMSARNVTLLLEGKALPYVDKDNSVKFFILSDKIMVEWRDHVQDLMSKFQFVSPEQIV